MATNYNPTFTALISYINDKIEKDVMPFVLNKALELLRKRIQLDVYGNTPNKWYADGSGKPTYEFLDAWVKGEVIRELNGVYGEIIYDYNTMSYNGKRYGTHSDINGNDVRQGLAKILNDLSYKNHYTSVIGVKYREPYFDNTIRELEEKLPSFVEEGLRHAGLK